MDNQLDRIEAGINVLVDTLLKQSTATPAPASSTSVAAYDRPELSANDAGLKLDGSVNIDGSRWVVSAGNNFAPAGTKVRESYGYISPTKTPRIWALAQKVLTADGFKAWDADWHAHPYGLYRVDLEGILREGKTEVNLMLFSYTTQRYTEAQQ